MTMGLPPQQKADARRWGLLEALMTAQCAISLAELTSGDKRTPVSHFEERLRPRLGVKWCYQMNGSPLRRSRLRAFSGLANTFSANTDDHG